MTNHLSLIQLVRTQIEQYQRVAWFLIEWAEREHRVMLRSVAAWAARRRSPARTSNARPSAVGFGWRPTTKSS